MSVKPRVQNVDQFLGVSPQFKKELFKSVLAILLFIIVYLLLFTLSLCLIAGCVYAGIKISSFRPKVWTFLIGLALVGTALMILIFLVKFLFGSYKIDETDCIQVTSEDHPKLFESLQSIAKRIGTHMPKKVLLVPDVNASVFYNSSFWSMFLPVPKNLKIGLGLVNTLNVSELEAVIAHEFGHFSQKSMKVGSWVYQVNNIIYDILYNNDKFTIVLGTFASGHVIFEVFVGITTKILQGIQWVLEQMYEIVNRSYRGLSREMEFHADLVSASVCGSNNLIHALRRIEVGDECYESVFETCDAALKEKKVATDFYAGHSLVMKQVGEHHKLLFEGPLPVIKDESILKLSRVNFKDQWSSHPTTTERMEYLHQFDLTSDTDKSIAWNLFQNKSALAEKMTEKIYRHVPADDSKQVMDPKEFEKLLVEAFQRDSYSPIFKGFYDGRDIEFFDVESLCKQPSPINSFEEVFDHETALLPKKLHFLRHDLSNVTAIEQGYIATRSFDFDGRKFQSTEAWQVVKQLEEEITHAEKELKASDMSIFRFFFTSSGKEDAKELKQAYERYFQVCRDAEIFFESARQINELLAPIHQGDVITMEQIQQMISTLQEQHEPALKCELRSWLVRINFTQPLKEIIQSFLGSNWQYFNENGLLENELEDLTEIIDRSADAVYRHMRALFKAITELQAHLVNKKLNGIEITAT